MDVTSIKRGIMSDLFRDGLNTSNLKDEEIGRLRTEVTRLAAVRTESKEIAAELQAQYPQIRSVVLGEGVEASPDPETLDRAVLFVGVQADPSLSEADRERIEVWLRVRARTREARLIFSPVVKPGARK